MNVIIKPIDGEPGFGLESSVTTGKTVESWLKDAGMEKMPPNLKRRYNPNINSKNLLTDLKSKKHAKIHTFYVTAPENVEAELVDVIGAVSEDNSKALDYVQRLDDLIFDRDTPFPEDNPTKSHGIPNSVTDVYEDLLGDDSSSYFSEKRFKIILLSSVYVCVRAYGECDLQVASVDSESKTPVSSDDVYLKPTPVERPENDGHDPGADDVKTSSDDDVTVTDVHETHDSPDHHKEGESKSKSKHKGKTKSSKKGR